jgi:hypothetical protein
LYKLPKDLSSEELDLLKKYKELRNKRWAWSKEQMVRLKLSPMKKAKK